MNDSVLLALLVVAPAIISIIILIICNKADLPWYEAIKKSFSLHPDLGLAKQGLFWWSIFTPALYFFVFGFACWQGHKVSITADGFKNFISISTLPLALLSISIPLGVTIARFHSTEQTARQILIAQLKNNLDAFYSHRKEFLAYFENIEAKTFLKALTVEYRVTPRLHGKIFWGQPEDGTPQLDYETMMDIITRLKSIKDNLNKVLFNTDPKETMFYYTEASKDVYFLARLFEVRELKDDLFARSKTLMGQKTDGTFLNQRTLGLTTLDAITAYRCVKSYALNILYFSGKDDWADEILLGDISYIDNGGEYINANPGGLVIEYNFSVVTGSWKTVPEHQLED